MSQASIPLQASEERTAQARGWWQELAARFVFDWKLKGGGTTSFVALFFVAYLWLQQSPFSAAWVMPEIWLDRWVPFQPWTLSFYITLWFYVSFPAALEGSRRGLLLYGAWSGIVAVAGLAIFAIWPTTIAVPDIDWTRHPGYAALKTIDAAGNACPSLHVTFAVFSGLALDRIWVSMCSPVWLRWASGLWGAAIVFSTLSTKQHVALDVAAGLVLGGVGGALFLARARRIPDTV